MKNISCGIDFGTSNSALSIVDGDKIILAELEGDKTSIPSAIFFNSDENHITFGRQAIDEYLEQYEGRFMRALKSILGSDLMEESTQVGLRRMNFSGIIGCFIGEIKQRAENFCGHELENVVMGRPVHFVDDDEIADKRAENELREIAKAQGFKHIAFEFEPIAAARDYESKLSREELVLVVDIGGGTSDFSVIRLSPDARNRQDRSDDILANGGIHIGGTDFDKRFSLDVVMPYLGYGTKLKNNLDMPRSEYNMLATWHLINFLYNPKNMSAVRSIYGEAERKDMVGRFLKVLNDQKGHEIASRVEAAKITLSDNPSAEIDLGFIEDGLNINSDGEDLARATQGDVEKIIKKALNIVEQGALIKPSDIDTIFMTGGSTALPHFVGSVQSAFPSSRIMHGDRFSSVVTGLGMSAARRYNN